MEACIYSTRTLYELTRLIAEKEHTIAVMQAKLAASWHSHLGILSGPAIRYELAQLDRPVDVLAFDWRKLHEWNEIMGYSPSNAFFGRAVRTYYEGPDRRTTPRALDLRGQWNGDEIVCAVDAGHGRGLLARLLAELAIMNREMSVSHRSAILRRTGGLIEGFAIAAVLIESSTHPLQDAARAVDATGTLKAGIVSGTRATSGARGTVLGRMERC